MKLSFLSIFLVTFSLYTLAAQEQNFSGKIVESVSKEPIDSALFILDNRIIASTDNKGVFDFNLYIYNLEDAITISHIAFKSKVIKLQDLINQPTILLSEQITQLETVIVDAEKKLTQKQILKAARTHYKEHLRKAPYWASVNLKQTLNYKDSLQSYFEIDGNMYTLAGNREQRAHRTIVIPLKARRTEENWYTDTFNDTLDSGRHFGNTEIFTAFHNYTFLETFHPLGKKGRKSFDFKIEKTVVFEDELYYLINYKEKKPIADYNTSIKRILKGQLWISKSDFSIKKIAAFSSYKTISSSNFAFTIEYQTNDKELFPQLILYNIFRNVKNGLNYHIEGKIDVIRIDKTSRENYSDFLYASYFDSNYVWKPLNMYDETYWNTKPISDERFKNLNIKTVSSSELDALFKDGVLQEIKSSKSRLQKEDIFTIDPKIELQKLMKRDLKIED